MSNDYNIAEPANGVSENEPGKIEVVAKAQRRQFSTSYKKRICAEADACTRPGELGALLRRRFMNVDPANRLVADALEADWNGKLRTLEEAQRTYEQQRQNDALLVNEALRCELLALANDLPRLWRRPETSDRERKRMVRLMIEDVTLVRNGHITLQVRLRGGAEKQLDLPRPARTWEVHQTPAEVVREVDRLLEDHLEADIAEILNTRGLTSGHGLPWSRSIIHNIRRQYKLKSRFERLRARGMLTIEEMADRLNVHHMTVKAWNRHGLLIAYPYSAKNECLYEPPGPDAPRKMPGKRLIGRTPAQPRVSTSQ